MCLRKFLPGSCAKTLVCRRTIIIIPNCVENAMLVVLWYKLPLYCVTSRQVVDMQNQHNNIQYWLLKRDVLLISFYIHNSFLIHKDFENWFSCASDIWFWRDFITNFSTIFRRIIVYSCKPPSFLIYIDYTWQA